VINLAPDKNAVFREVSRVLRPGGRLAVSDIALKQPLPEEVGSDLMAYVGCVAGAIPIEEYKRGLLDAGFAHVEIIDSKADLTAYVKVEDQLACCATTTTEPKGLPIVTSACCGQEEAKDGDLYRVLADLLRRYNINDYAASVKVFAVKP
jgi:arsenite methyltransferase